MQAARAQIAHSTGQATLQSIRLTSPRSVVIDPISAPADLAACTLVFETLVPGSSSLTRRVGGRFSAERVEDRLDASGTATLPCAGACP